ncbi:MULTISPECIES: 3-hydroxyacyl-ACP dehydratase FabZ [Cetobacterium]|jgi:3-hydroxyacyl-[acyl-carrier-protein] dehydratase|uniref:3-hydroxyacyl-[acyl-carrier-protein] dehydratase FabZ n=1 Tax=Cetobacterium somerae ATCC BAA-474 TaxID=1319815 RepID=U7VEY7_9FUSO|nr:MULTISPECIES: 3-hydroxyacyl-ACP dehydratase FabZ [Cetobacterium]ERT69669.1 beta-hydroxyacyl-(acyl-carrier-protein) dehydratase FabZ [Cetobacterium somerae ATCC BAA-474]MBC2853381.1 3-hydroxyacyl-ACP dehydratase FabZ [Cetobacterium sp. 2G large]MCQ8211275.1 3-hydroxyacyl-ACP dehydratase FabZ [Cetobacterium sp. NK01]MCQ9625819.1 3-hydroxyacyl-ACP dehydratase FabZ [Cetobacterium somerae]MCX3066119.1 3-hydroxyacyl-ACP dehydratase FabZ [Cetobacterium somerae]
MLDVMEIMKRIPHRYPFLLVDRVLEMDKEAQKIRGLKNVTVNEEFFNGHFPGHPIMPGVLIVEGMAQCLGVLVLDDTEGKVPYFAAIENVKFKAPVRPGDQLIYEVQVDKLRRNIVKATGVAKVDDKVVTEASFTFTIMEK